MFDYVTKELPALVSGLFPVDPVKMSITGKPGLGGGDKIIFAVSMNTIMKRIGYFLLISLPCFRLNILPQKRELVKLKSKTTLPISNESKAFYCDASLHYVMQCQDTPWEDMVP